MRIVEAHYLELACANFVADGTHGYKLIGALLDYGLLWVRLCAIMTH